MSLAALGELVDAVEIPADGDSLRAVLSIGDRLAAKVALAVRAFEHARGPEADGAVSTAAWLRQQAGRDQATARELASNGRKLERLPTLAAAVLAGEVSGGQLDAVLTHVPMRHLDRFADHEADVVPTLVGLTATATAQAMALWRQRADALDDGPAPVDRPNEIHFATTLDDRGELRGSFDADMAALLEAALRVGDPKDFSLSLAERRAIALAQACQTFLDHQRTRTGGRHRPHLNVVISYEDFCAANGLGARYLDTGQPVSPAALGVLCCDSALHRLLFSGTSGILDYGRATRQWPPDVYNAIALRDGGCRIGNCDAPPWWCDVHHITFWEDGGTTGVDSGVMGCRHHHQLLHRPGYSFKLLPDGTTELTHPNGRVEVSHPRGPAPAARLGRRRPPTAA